MYKAKLWLQLCPDLALSLSACPDSWMVGITLAGGASWHLRGFKHLYLEDFFFIRVLSSPFRLDETLTLGQIILRSVLTSSTHGDQAQWCQPMLAALMNLPGWEHKCSSKARAFLSRIDCLHPCTTLCRERGIEILLLSSINFECRAQGETNEQPLSSISSCSAALLPLWKQVISYCSKEQVCSLQKQKRLWLPTAHHLRGYRGLSSSVIAGCLKLKSHKLCSTVSKVSKPESRICVSVYACACVKKDNQLFGMEKAIDFF